MSIISDQLSYTLEKYENNNIDGDFYNGKVRDNYFFKDKVLMITSDRVSAFDHVLGTIPFLRKALFISFASSVSPDWYKAR